MKIALLREKRTGGILTSYILNDDEHVPDEVQSFVESRGYTLLVHPVSFKFTPEVFLGSVMDEILAWEEG